MLSFENSAFVCLAIINLIGIVSAFVIPKRGFLKMPKAFQKLYVVVFFGAPMLVLPLLPQTRFEVNYVTLIIGIILALLSALIWILAF